MTWCVGEECFCEDQSKNDVYSIIYSSQILNISLYYVVQFPEFLNIADGYENTNHTIVVMNDGR